MVDSLSDEKKDAAVAPVPDGPGESNHTGEEPGNKGTEVNTGDNAGNRGNEVNTGDNAGAPTGDTVAPAPQPVPGGGMA